MTGNHYYLSTKTLHEVAAWQDWEGDDQMDFTMACREVLELREVRIATLVEAAGLICDNCKVGGPWFGAWFDLVDKFYRVEHPGGAAGTSYPCDAERIIKKLVKEWAW